jgi:hypothetical protein
MRQKKWEGLLLFGLLSVLYLHLLRLLLMRLETDLVGDIVKKQKCKQQSDKAAGISRQACGHVRPLL